MAERAGDEERELVAQMTLELDAAAKDFLDRCTPESFDVSVPLLDTAALAAVATFSVHGRVVAGQPLERFEERGAAED